MKGRDDENKRLKGSKSDVFYKPNYECNSPHIPGFVFKPSDIKKDYKKYRIGKILRSYIFDPYKYFVMDINENISNSQEKSNISIHLNKKNKNKSHKININLQKIFLKFFILLNSLFPIRFYFSVII